MDWPAFSERINSAAGEAFAQLRASRPSETFYAFALYTDSGAMTVVAAANSLEGLERLAGGLDPTRRRARAWLFSEWAYCGLDTPAMEALCKSLREDLARGVDFDAFVTRLHAAMIDALRRMDAAGEFGLGAERDKMTAFISISDDDRSTALENASAKALNPPQVYERFLHRLG